MDAVQGLSPTQTHRIIPAETKAPSSATVAKTIVVANGIIDSIPNNLENNTTKIVEQMLEAYKTHLQGANRESHLLFHTPELSINTYQSEDYFIYANLQGRAYNERVEEQLKRFIKATEGKELTASVGFAYVADNGKQLILHALISEGKIVSIKGKEDLANNIGAHRGVEYETRYFTPCKHMMKITLLGTQYHYGMGIFSQESVVIAGKRVALVICEEMFTGTDNLGQYDAKLNNELDLYMTELLKETAPKDFRARHSQIPFLRDFILKSLSSDTTIIINKSEFGEEMTSRLNAKFASSFEEFRRRYQAHARSNQKASEFDVVEQSRLFNALQRSDIVLVPNGSPSATGKYDTRVRLLKLIGETYRKGCVMVDGEKKKIFYSNHNGSQAGSIPFDGNVIETTITKEKVAVEPLNIYSYGVFFENNPSVPHYLTPKGQERIASLINSGIEYYSGPDKYRIRFGNAVKNVYPKFYQETEFAYKNLLKRLDKFSNVEGILEEGEGSYFGNFISLSGGFDSAHTLITRSKMIELRLRQLAKQNGGSIDGALNALIAELKLNQRAFNPVQFSRFLNRGHLSTFCKLLGCNAEGVRTHLQQCTTIEDVIRLINTANQPAEEKLALLSQIVIFHTVKAAYLRTKNNSTKTERAARQLAEELGADFEVRDIDSDFKVALLLEKGVQISDYSPATQGKILAKYTEILDIEKEGDRQNEIEFEKSRINKGRNVENAVRRIEALTQALSDDKAKLARLKGELNTLLGKEVDVHNWFESKNGLEIENIQARVRAYKNWQIGVSYGLMPTSNPNTDEAKQGYTTFTGDLHAGEDSSTADLRKTEILGEMALLMKDGFHDDTNFQGNIAPIQAILYTFKQPPSAELQNGGDDVDTTFSQQTDEGAYGMSYLELSFIGDRLFQLSKNGAHFVRLGEVYDSLEKQPSVFRAQHLGNLLQNR